MDCTARRRRRWSKAAQRGGGVDRQIGDGVERQRGGAGESAGLGRRLLLHLAQRTPRGNLVSRQLTYGLNPVKLEKRRSSVLHERGDGILAKQLGGMALQRNPSLKVAKCQFSPSRQILNSHCCLVQWK